MGHRDFGNYQGDQNQSRWGVMSTVCFSSLEILCNITLAIVDFLSKMIR
ncbi:hypothetical protein AALP_AA1G186100 [Arabis alpina]|uniref:Uncharacterized protein n=1 Tax=Arabis alpina TaxID=50452 RepID=A0A087HP30_ARAAL|nr:hypothetical protein AALP_AA1G186100 [Arabis alpina]